MLFLVETNLKPMDPPSPFRYPPRESLQPLSPHRINTMTSSHTSESDYPDYENRSPTRSPRKIKEMGYTLPASPSLPEINAFQRTHVRANSDVQNLVTRFEHLHVRDREAEKLRRAEIGREEAEQDVKRLREDVRRLKKEGDESRERERKVCKRLEVVMDEFAMFKEAQTSQLSIYEKEVRKVRKEAFKSSSAVLKLQEELKSTRNSLRITQSGLDMEKRRVQQRDQQTFDAQYQLVAIQEQLDKLRTHLHTVEQEREALKTSLKEEEVARIAAQGMIALPLGLHEDDDLSSPQVRRTRSQPLQKRPASSLSDDKENAGVVTKKMVESKVLAEALRWETVRREQAEELADFLRLECHFKCCECRSRRDSVQDCSALREAFSETSRTAEEQSPETHQHLRRSVTLPAADEPAQRTPAPETSPDCPPEDQDMADEALVDDDEDLPTSPSTRPTTPPPLTATTIKVPLAPSSPLTPSVPHPTTPARLPSLRTITTTTTIPMHFTPVAKAPAAPMLSSRGAPDSLPSLTAPRGDEIPPSPDRGRSGSVPAVDREKALAMIAYRRGRAKSIAMGQATPRRIVVDARRDITR
jgi:hypothetical protein